MRNGLPATTKSSSQLLERCFEEIAGYDEIVLLRDVRFESHCEHHVAHFIGSAHIAYLPDRRVVGISKLARLVQVFTKRLQIQERMTAETRKRWGSGARAGGVAVVIEAVHERMTTRVYQLRCQHGNEPDAGRIPADTRRPVRNFSLQSLRRGARLNECSC